MGAPRAVSPAFDTDDTAGGGTVLDCTVPAAAPGRGAERLRSCDLEGAADDVGGAPLRRRGPGISAGRARAGRPGRDRASPSACPCSCPSPSPSRGGETAPALGWAPASSSERPVLVGRTSARAVDCRRCGGSRSAAGGAAPRTLRRSSGRRAREDSRSPRPDAATDSESGWRSSARREAWPEDEPPLVAEAGGSLPAGGQPTPGVGVRRSSPGCQKDGRRGALAGACASAARGASSRLLGLASGAAVAAATPGRPPSAGGRAARAPCRSPCRWEEGRGARGTSARRARRGWPASGPSG